MPKVKAFIEFHHIDRGGDLWVDWTNEFGAGKKRVWRVISRGEKTTTKLLEFGVEERILGITLGKTVQSQIFTAFTLELTDLTPENTPYHLEPSHPYNILGVKKVIHIDKERG